MRAEHDVLAVGGRADAVDGALDDAAQVHRPHVETEPAGHDARDVEQVFDELSLGARVALDGLERAALHHLVHGAAPEPPDPAEHGGERRAELMRDGGEELVLHPVRRFRRRARGLLRREEVDVAQRRRALVGQTLHDALVQRAERNRSPVRDEEQPLDPPAEGDGHDQARRDSFGLVEPARIGIDRRIAAHVVAARGATRRDHAPAEADTGTDPHLVVAPVALA